ncbi:uncharacterized protein LOC113146686 [Cyclospora cayetanensis]|uniref:Uncharacterized protein LOC113146686 n=1 Tax=Cyclospora cayetanensis TaxID=88456 RepID=A0A6P6RTZ1_9EIME|nr:uncharacterized protein LOC113146686 [Cyclospora cayetanensis]
MGGVSRTGISESFYEGHLRANLISQGAQRHTKTPESPKSAEEAAALLESTPLQTFALPSLALVAVILEILPPSKDSTTSAISSVLPEDDKSLDIEQEHQEHSGFEKLEQSQPSVGVVANAVAAKSSKLQQVQQRDLFLLEQRQMALRNDLRSGLITWTEVTEWKLTLLEIQRLILRIVELKMPPTIAALLPLPQQIQGFLRLLTAAVTASSTVQHSFGLEGAQEDQQTGQQHSLAADESPTARSDASIATTATGFGEHTSCFWRGFCGVTLRRRQMCDVPLMVDEFSDSDLSGSEAGTECTTTTNSTATETTESLLGKNWWFYADTGVPSARHLA